MSVARRDRASVSGGACAAVAAAAIVLLWGAIPLIVAVERRLASDLQWLGHAGFHVWTATVSAALCVIGLRALRSRQVPDGMLRPLAIAATIAAGVMAAANALEVVGAHPSQRVFHDLVNAVGAPVNWALLAVLISVVIVGVAVGAGGKPER